VTYSSCSCFCSAAAAEVETEAFEACSNLSISNAPKGSLMADSLTDVALPFSKWTIVKVSGSIVT
jgi:hypothetical protein